MFPQGSQSRKSLTACSTYFFVGKVCDRLLQDIFCPLALEWNMVVGCWVVYVSAGCSVGDVLVKSDKSTKWFYYKLYTLE